MKIETMEDLLLAQIQDLYDAEQRLVKALPKMAEATTSSQLRQAFTSHLSETKGQVERLERIFDELREDPKATTCDAMKGLIKEGETVISDTDQSPVRDAGLIAAANRVEHYEIAAYGSARTFAETLGLANVARLLEETLQEEKKADQTLTQIGENVVNDNAMQTKVAQ